MKTNCQYFVSEKLVQLKPHAVIGPMVDYYTDFIGQTGSVLFIGNHAAHGFASMSVGLTRDGLRGPTVEFGLN